MSPVKVHFCTHFGELDQPVEPHSIPDHYPAWLEKRHRNEGKNLDEVTPIEAHLEWELADVKVIEERFGAGVVKAGDALRLYKTYDNNFRWHSGCDEQQAVRNFVERQQLPSSEKYLF